MGRTKIITLITITTIAIGGGAYIKKGGKPTEEAKKHAEITVDNKAIKVCGNNEEISANGKECKTNGQPQSEKKVSETNKGFPRMSLDKIDWRGE